MLVLKFSNASNQVSGHPQGTGKEKQPQEKKLVTKKKQNRSTRDGEEKDGTTVWHVTKVGT